VAQSNRNPIKIADGVKVNSFNRVLKQAISSPRKIKENTALHREKDILYGSNGDLRFSGKKKKNSVVTERGPNLINTISRP